MRLILYIAAAALAALVASATDCAAKLPPLPARPNVWVVARSQDVFESRYIAQFAMEEASGSPRVKLILRCNGYTREFEGVLSRIPQDFDYRILYKFDNNGSTYFGLFIFNQDGILSFNASDAMPAIFEAKKIAVRVKAIGDKHLDFHFEIPPSFAAERDEVLKHCNPPNRE